MTIRTFLPDGSQATTARNALGQGPRLRLVEEQAGCATALDPQATGDTVVALIVAADGLLDAALELISCLPDAENRAVYQRALEARSKCTDLLEESFGYT